MASLNFLTAGLPFSFDQELKITSNHVIINRKIHNLEADMASNTIHNPIIAADVDEIISNDLPWETLRGKTILVTGASGMIPSYVVYSLLGLNDKYGLDIHIIALVRNESKAKRILGDVLNRSDISLLVHDVCDKFDIDGSVDYIFHGGSSAKPSEHKTTPTSTIRANLTGTFNLLDLATQKHSQAFILMSSSEVYGQVADDTEKIKETDYGTIDILNPRACYSEGKRAAETICTCFAAQYGIDCKLPRFAHIYGPGLALDDGRVQADFASHVFYGKDIVLNSDGSSKRAYTYVADAVSGVFYILLKGHEMAYNVADSSNIISIKELAEAFIAARPEKHLQLTFNIPDKDLGIYNPAKFIGLDGSRLEALGWIPKTDIAHGCDKMLANYEFTYSNKLSR